MFYDLNVGTTFYIVLNHITSNNIVNCIFSIIEVTLEYSVPDFFIYRVSLD